jgi:3-oxoacyl-[acyl-carrier protein] reductase
MNLELSGKNALVTGGAGGLGLAIVRCLASEGAHIAVADRKAPPEGVPGRYLATDLADSACVEKLVAEAWEALGSLDILINNAGIWPTAWFTEMATDHWERTMRINLTAPMILCRDFSRMCLERKREGVVLNIVSQAAFGGAKSGHADYSASKAGLVNLTRTMTGELARRGIRVNALAPGMMETSMSAEVLAERRESYLERIPLGRVADPAEVADVAVFLCSKRAGYIAGATIDISGGMLLH